MRRRALVILVIIIATVFLAIIWQSRKQPTVRYKLAKVKYATVVELVSESGNLMPAAAYEVFSSLSGKVSKVYVTNGQEVAAGDDLFTVENEQTGQERVVEAPAAGKITNLAVSEGEHVVASGQTGAAGQNLTPVLLVADLSHYYVKLLINEVDISKLKSGQNAKIFFDAVPGKTFKGKVSRVDTIGTNNQGVVSYNVFVDLKNPTSELRPMMTADVDIEVQKKERVLTVPNAALKPYKGGKAVRLLTKGKKVKYQPVEVGIVGVNRTEITKGLKENQDVIVGEIKTVAPRGLFSPPAGD